jgi:hypothetical protein
MVWRELEAAAPEIARLGLDRLAAMRVAMLGTVRADGSPRISPIEPYISQGHLLVGVMTRSAKARDLQADPRYVLHSAISAPDSGEGELTLSGRAAVAPDVVREGCAEGWWIGRPPEFAWVLSLAIEEAAFISWDTEGGEMTLRRWTPGRGYRQHARPYP